MARRKGRRRFGRRRRMRKAFNGGLVRGRMHPPTSTASPWNSYVLTSVWTASETAGIQCVNKKQIVVGIRTELGMKEDVKIDIRLVRADVWVPPPACGSDKNFIVLSPSDWTQQAACGSWSQLNWYESWGTAVQPAHVHYVWPKSISNVVMSDASDATVYRFDVKAKVQYILKNHVLWRISTPDPRPTQGVGEFSSMRGHLHRATSPDAEARGFDLCGLASVSPLATDS